MKTRINEVPILPRLRHACASIGMSIFFSATVLLLSFGSLEAQETAVEKWAAQSAIVVSGKVLRVNASDDRLVPPSNRVAVISIQRMYAGSEIAGDQTGHTATIILSKPESLKPGEEAVFFGNPRFVGRTLTIADQGEISSRSLASFNAALQRGLQARHDRPIVDRLNAATSVFRGSVEGVHPLESNEKNPAESSEHDPEWQVATVRVTKPLRDGEAGQEITILFPGSRDIVWFNSPKLREGQDAIFIAHAPLKDEERLLGSRTAMSFVKEKSAYLVTQPFDVLSGENEERVRVLLSTKETK